jgi:hypothetical protein
VPAVPAATSASSDFGVVIAAKDEHLHWVRGTLASVRHFMQGAPICILLDGDRLPSDLERACDVVVRRDDLEPRVLRAGFGSLRAKDAVLWASPFETFLLLDADTVVWGDMRELADFDRFDFVVDSAAEPSRSVMALDLVARYVPDFDAGSHTRDFTNTGAYFGRRNILDLEYYLELERLSSSYPGMFYGSQGTFNLMVFSGADQGKLRVEQRELQLMTWRVSREELVRRCPMSEAGPLVTGDPLVLHWVGSPKPRVREGRDDYFAPMTFFRLEARRTARADARRRRTDLLRLRLEDALCRDWRGTNLRGKYGRFRRRLDQRWASWRVALRARVPDRLVETLRR